ncbi:UDP-2,4-diacetamido-2,4,6-trideoxy-beta-L-altropyranose hydrolase [Gammaproteobacteria bacterium]|nr:UDP-2,4-diacetamido-2,4,6-trideoxy-beta-L-altropyranose hydrolase [Gammaproteobacteria bacterium]
MKAVLRVDASLEIGSGHVMRCLALANTLKNNHFIVEFICRKHDGNLIDRIYEEGFKVHELQLGSEDNTDHELEHSSWLGVSQKQDAEDCINVLNNELVDWIVVDSYALDEVWHGSLKPFCSRLMVIDDLANRNYQCDILLDQTFGRDKKDYINLTPSNCQSLVSSKFALLRPDFADLRLESLARRKHPKLSHLLINMGGIDVTNITEIILDHLKISDLKKELNITIIMGENSPHLQSVRNKAADLKQKTKVLVGVKNMAQIMTSADIAIGASGTTTWERCCLGLPSIQLAISTNQEYLAKILHNNKIIKLVQEVKEVSCLLESAEDWMKDVGTLCAEICDGFGTKRVLNKMTNKTMLLKDFNEIELCNYTNLDQDDVCLALEMRNHEEIRSWMYNQKHISLPEHLSFIDKLGTKTKTRYFLVKQKGHVIGSINFSKIKYGNSADFGIYANPLSQLKGLGKVLEEAGCKYAFEELGVVKINLEVLESNKKAIDFYTRCGYEFVNKTIINDQDVICMKKQKS